MQKYKDDPESLQGIPGVGKSIAEDLKNIGITKTSELCGRDPQQLFDLSNAYAGVIQDRCLLYTFRCAVYFAQGGRDAEKLKWWNWKDSQ